MKHMKKLRKLQTLIMNNYIAFTLVFLLSFFLFLCATVFFAWKIECRENKKLSGLLLPDLGTTSFDELDLDVLLACNGSLTILNEDFDVVFQAGSTASAITNHSPFHLLQQIEPGISISQLATVGIISFDLTLSTVTPAATSAATTFSRVFTGIDDQIYLSLETIPNAYLTQRHYTIFSPNNHSTSICSGIFVLIGGILLLFLNLKLFSRRISDRIDRPVSALTNGLKKITEGKYETRLEFNAENELSQMKDAFNYMAVQMEQAKKEKESYDSERQILFSNIAHDLKTPITTIQGYAKALSQDLVLSEAEKKEYYQGIYQKSVRINELIDLLFTYTKLENQQFQLTLEQHDLMESLRKIIAGNYDLLEEKQMQIDICLPEHQKLICNFDLIELDRAISNLLINVAKHNPEGTHVLVSLTQTKNQCLIDIADDGVPIPTSIEHRLFEPFVLGDESRRSRSGNGLGLSISKKIVEKHGGSLSLLEQDALRQTKSLKGYTKCFRIVLPLNL